MRRPEAQTPSLRGSTLVQLSGDGGTIRVAGEVDLSNVDALRAVLDREQRRGGDLTLDLGALTFIDLAGMRALHRAAIMLGRTGSTLTLRSPPALLTEVLAQLELDAPTSMRIVRAGAPYGGGRPDPNPSALRRPLVNRVARMLAARDGARAGRPAGAR